jgi:hypothetical protein
LMADKIETELIVEAVAKGFDKVNKSMGSLEKSQKGVNTETKKSEGIFQKVQGNFAAIAVGGAVVAGSLTVAKKAFDFAAEGQKIKTVEATFGQLARSIGSDSDSIIASMNEATGGIVSNLDMMQAANQFMAMGLANTEEEVAKLSGTAVRLGQAMGKDATQSMEEFSLLLANQSIPRLDTFGISAGKVRTRIKELREETEDMTREEAFMIAVSEEAETSLERLGDAVPDDEFAKLTKNINDFIDSSKKAASETGGLISLLNDYIDVVKKNNRQSELLNDAWRQGRISGAEYSSMIRSSGEDVEAFVAAEEKLIAAMKAEIDIRRGMIPDQQEMSIWIAENTGNLGEWTEEIIKANKAAIKFANQGLGQIDETLGKATRSGLWKVAGTHIQGIIDSLAEDLEPVPVLAEIPDQLTLFNENLEDIGPTLVMIGGRTGDQNRILSEAQRRYDAAGQAIHDYQVGLRGFGKSADDVNEIIGDLTDKQAHWNRLINDYGNIQGEATLATVEATRNQEAINAAFFDGLEVTEENKMAVLGLQVATGELTEAQAAAIVEQWNMEAAIRAIQEAWAGGNLTDGEAVRALDLVGKGFINRAADAREFIDVLVPMNNELDGLAGDHNVNIVTSGGTLADELDGLANFYNAEITSTATTVKEEEVDPLLVELDQLSTARGLETWDAKITSNAIEVKDKEITPLQAASDDWVDRDPYEAEFDALTALAEADILTLKGIAEDTAGTYNIHFNVTSSGNFPSGSSSNDTDNDTDNDNTSKSNTVGGSSTLGGFVIHQTFHGPTDPKAVKRAAAGAVAEILGARG